MNLLNRLKHEFTCIRNANSIILNYPDHDAKRNRVNLHYYHADWQDGAISNLGDYLSEIVVHGMLRHRGINCDTAVTETRHLYAIGSIIQMGYQDATIWGTGFAFELGKLRSAPHRHRKLDVRCVRGPKTRKTLMDLGFDCPETYGDPGILMPLLYEPKHAESTDFLIIPHYSMEQQAISRYGTNHVLSMNTKDYCTVIDRICSAEKVISSSLHGIILAEAYGIPAVFCQDRPVRFNYKYEDWYESTGRNVAQPATSVEDALKQEVREISLRRLKNMQENLIEKFPADLWA